MKYRSALQSRVEQLGMTFTFNHICCRTIEVDRSLMEYPEDLWFVSVSLLQRRVFLTSSKPGWDIGF